MHGYWYSLRVRVGIRLKLWGCALIHGRGRHLWGAWADRSETHQVRACRSCGTYDFEALHTPKQWNL